jgi:uncharacterized membrane protein (DUF4010 family)
MSPADTAPGLVVAALGGAVVGLERQWSGHAEGPAARFAGIRTFSLLGLAGGVTGTLIVAGYAAAATTLAAGAVALVVAAYVAASRTDVDGTTEVAALVVFAAGILAGTGALAVASGLAVFTGLLLIEKSRLHAFAARLDATNLRAGLRFAAMATVILPLLPAGPVGPAPGVRPRELWALVLFFSGLSFLGHIARQAVSARHADWIAGALGGLVSSTSVTLTFARLSRERRASGWSLAAGALAANAMLVPRVVTATAVLHPALAVALVPWLALPAVLLVVATTLGARRVDGGLSTPTTDANPLRVAAALQMALLFQGVLFVVDAARRWYGTAGVFTSAAGLGVTDVDALTVTMARSVAPALGIETAARALVVGILANTILKAAIAIAIGRAGFRVLCGGVLAVTAAWLAASLWRW